MNNLTVMNENQLVVPGEGGNILAQLEMGHQALAQARDDFDRIKIRDTAKALEVAAGILKHKGIQVEASMLVMDAEREVAKANPPNQGARSDLKKKAPKIDGLNSETKRKIRQAHAHVEDDEYEEIKLEARKQESPLTRKKIHDTGRIKHKAEGKAIIVKRRRAMESATPSHRMDLHTCSIQELIPLGHVEPGSIDAIITDPPYDRGAFQLFKWLTEFAAQALRPGGSLICLTGTMFWREQLALMEEGAEGTDLKYWWTICYDMASQPSQAARIFARKVFVVWKPIFWFVQGSYTGEWVKDALHVPFKTGEVKAYHKWGQHPVAFDSIMEDFAYPGQLVCDPFLGGGTTALCARNRGCDFIGCDIDPDAVRITDERLLLMDEPI